MFTKRALFPKANSALSLPSECRFSSETVNRIHKLLRNLSTAVQRLDFGNPNGYQIENPSHFSGDISPRAGGEVSESAVHTQSHDWSSNHGRYEQPWQQNYQGNSNSISSWSSYRNGGSSWDSGNNTTFDYNNKIAEFDDFCEREYLKMALTTMESLEKKGHVMDLARLLRISQLCVEEGDSLEGKVLQEAKVSIQGKIRALVHLSDANYVKYYTDFVVQEFDAFCKHGKVRKALYTIDTLESMSHVVDLARLLRLAKLCGEVEAPQEAKAVHWKISSSVSCLDVSSHHVLMEMYSDCGLVDETSGVFEGMPEKDMDSWNIMIRGLAKNGLGEEAIDMFTRFKSEGNKPDSQLFRGIFYTCGLLGDVDEGLLHFESMTKEFGIVPTIEDYVSIVEMFALPGFLEEALEFVERMPMEANAEVWETLMNLSRVHGDLELGDRCAEAVEELDPTRLNKQSKDGYLPVKESDVERVSLKKKSGVHGLGGCTTPHQYQAGDANLPEHGELFELLRNMKMHMVEVGYVVATKVVLHDLDEETKENALLAHSERAAFARGLLSSAPRSTITVLKNLRVCIDCHNAFKIMAELVGRTVVMRDNKRFHHMKDGGCSCKDYW
ncbi:unnamed protein product [Microthlaspi erraticum]|uniref:DYW domain-containing protein n=1 Tax=Microthlaspi erraticum TaxID=1685480 RepID=A0A6D2J733_9BRAS|nr:unnamed protein product [Microthlaspi erraticum]